VFSLFALCLTLEASVGGFGSGVFRLPEETAKSRSQRLARFLALTQW